MKLSTPIQVSGQDITELTLPPRVKAKYLKGVKLGALSDPTVDDMQRVVEGVFQLNSGAAGEMTLDDLISAFSEAAGFLSGTASQKKPPSE